MKILFSQTSCGENQPVSILESFGIEQCYLKNIVFDKDYKNMSLKTHHHTNFEIHLIKNGYQVYEIGDKLMKFESGQLLLISPLVKHRAAETGPDTVKNSITFSFDKDSLMAKSLNNTKEYELNVTPDSVSDSIEYIAKERKLKGEYYNCVIQNRMFECIINILRLLGINDILKQKEEEKEDIRIAFARQYINDNIEKHITVDDIASYCNLSNKQITRIFLEAEGSGVAEYIRKQKSACIEKLLSDGNLTLREISEKMSFNNEYYFNAFVKKNLGMSPGEYRKSVKQNPGF